MLCKLFILQKQLDLQELIRIQITDISLFQLNSPILCIKIDG